MATSDTPAWLKAMENGGLGEARARAFLMDRFWVLERSVDVEGADYLIQRRMTSRNFMDREPPRLGVIQVKFIQDGGTSISVHKRYVCDPLGNPYGEFFLLVFTGREDSEKSYLLGAREVLSEFNEVIDGDRTFLRIKGSTLLATSNYEIVQKGRALNRIEHALSNADFLLNRHFLGRTTYFKISPDHIDVDLLAPLDNSYGEIRKTFFDEKKKVQRELLDLEEVVEAMHTILRSTDPEVAFDVYEEVISQHVGHNGLHFACDFFNDEDFLATVKNHKARLSKVRELGLEGNYFRLLAAFQDEVFDALIARDFDLSAGICVEVTYDPDTLRKPSVDVSLKGTIQNTPYVKTSRKGRQVIYYDLHDVLGTMKSSNQEARLDKVRARIWRLSRPFQAAVDALYLGPDFVAF